MKNSVAHLLLMLVPIAFVSAVRYVEYRPGSSNIILSVPHGGRLRPNSIRSRDYGCRRNGKCVYSHNCGKKDKKNCAVRVKMDYWTLELAERLSDELFRLSGKRPHLIINNLHRSKMDANREIDDATFGNPAAKRAWLTYHKYITFAKARIASFGLLLDIHGQSHIENWTELGYLRTKDKLANVRESHYKYSSIRNLKKRTRVNFKELLRGWSSLGGRLQAFGYRVAPSPSIPNPKSYRYFSGGYYPGGYTIRKHSSRYGGVIDGIQIEAPASVRSASAGPRYARNLAYAIHAFTAQYY